MASNVDFIYDGEDDINDEEEEVDEIPEEESELTEEICQNQEKQEAKIINTQASVENGKKLDHFEKISLINIRLTEFHNNNILFIPPELVVEAGLTDSIKIITFEVEFAIQLIIDSRSEKKFILPEHTIDKINYQLQFQHYYNNAIDSLFLDDFIVFPDQSKFRKIYNKHIAGTIKR